MGRPRRRKGVRAVATRTACCYIRYYIYDSCTVVCVDTAAGGDDGHDDDDDDNDDDFDM